MGTSDIGFVVVVSGLSCAVGAVIAHILTKQHMTALYEGLIEEEVDKAKAFYSKRNEEAAQDTNEESEELSEEDPEEVDDEGDRVNYNKITASYGAKHIRTESVLRPNDGESMEEFEQRLIDEAKAQVKEVLEETEGSDDETDEEDVVVHRNIFQTHGQSDDNELDRSNRDSRYPYIISREEFEENENEYNQNTLTYYEADNTLVDERDQPIQPINTVVGDRNLKFGHASGDMNIVYVRNENLEVDFEVCRSYGSFAEEVLGFVGPDRGRENKGLN